MDDVAKLKQEIEEIVGLAGSDAEMFWALSKKCGVLAFAPTVAAGAKWGPGLIGAGTVALPGVGTVSGTALAVLMLGAVWTGSYASCMSLLPALIRFRDDLARDPIALDVVQKEIKRLVTAARSPVRA